MLHVSGLVLFSIILTIMIVIRLFVLLNVTISDGLIWNLKTLYV